MHKIVFVALLAVLLFPIQHGFSAELYDTNPTLTVSLSDGSHYVYRDTDGYIVVIGQVTNTNSRSPISDVQLRADFFDDQSLVPLESVTGNTTLDVIPPMGSSPFMIRSSLPTPAITQASVDLVGFNLSAPKLKQLEIQTDNIAYVSGTLSFTGTLTNGGAPIQDTNIYVVFYDAFEPPRIVGMQTIPIGTMLPNDTAYFEFKERIMSPATGFYLISESSIFYSDPVDMKMPEQEIFTKLVTITNVVVRNQHGNIFSEIPLDTPVNIESESWIQFSEEQSTNETPYTYFVQIKRFGEPYIEFVEKYDGRYIGTGGQYQSVDWIPENPGQFFIETFVWDRNNIPIANPGPLVLITVK